MEIYWPSPSRGEGELRHNAMSCRPAVCRPFYLGWDGSGFGHVRGFEALPMSAQSHRLTIDCLSYGPAGIGRLVALQPIDLFPQTCQVETVALAVLT